jgi:Lrp/AsnC family transcriptional regulator
MTLTEIARNVGLSVDSTKKRLDKMEKAGIFHPKIQIRPRRLGFQYVVDIKVKLNKYTDKQLKEFIANLLAHPRVAELIQISGQWDFTIVLIAKDHEDLAAVTEEIRKKFCDIISNWSESITTVVYKFERYEMEKIAKEMKNEENKSNI